MINNRVLSLISLSKKANKLVFGFDTIKEACEKNLLKLILTANDLSQKTNKEILFLCEKYQIKHIKLQYNMDDIQHYVSKRVGTLGVTDEGLSNKIILTITSDKNQEGNI